MTHFKTTLFALFVIASAVGQSGFPTRQLNVHWEAVQNGYQGRAQSLNAITFTNHNKTDFPASGWKIYFNSARMMPPAAISGNVNFQFINGDLFCMAPAAGFSPIKPGSSLRIEYLSDDPVINFTDGPEGFYVVWDHDAQKGYATGAFSSGDFKPTYSGLVTPEIIFAQNGKIKDLPAASLKKIFPTPLSYQESNDHFIISPQLRITIDGRFAAEGQMLVSTLETLLGKKIMPTPAGSSLNLEYMAGLAPEGYEMDINSSVLIIRASTATGIFHGIQSLKMLVPAANWARPSSAIEIPAVSVKDEPRFGYRAFMLDVGRNFQPKKEVLKLLDLIALYKLNVFRFHLTEDEGWRLELPSIPELTAVGSQRGHTTDTKDFLPPSHGSGPDTGIAPGSGFYTRKDFIEILRYANERHILVVPEIETPGHARAAIKAMNVRYQRLMAQGRKEEAERYLLYDPEDKSVYSTAQYWNDNVINPALPSTYRFIETVINDIVGIYQEADVPLKTIHFGGDEVPAHVWEKSPAYLSLKAGNPEIQSTDDLWYYFYGKINEMVKAKGLYLSGWEEMGLRKTKLDGNQVYLPNPDFVKDHFQTDVWNNTLGGGNEDLAYKLANAGYKVVLAPVTNFYFDMAHYKSYDEPGYYWGAFTDLDKPFSFIPFDYFKNSVTDRNGLPLDRSIFVGKQRLTDYGKSNIVGLQCAVWGETIKSTERLEYMLLPRLLGFAERAWSQDPVWATTSDTAKAAERYATDWSEFLNVLAKRQLPVLDYYMGGFGYRIPKPGVTLNNGLYEANIQFPGMLIRYTNDGKDPDAKSAAYQAPVRANGKTLKFRAFDSRGRGGQIATINP